MKRQKKEGINFFWLKNIKTEEFLEKDSRETKSSHYQVVLSRKINILPVILFKKSKKKKKRKEKRKKKHTDIK